VVCTLRPVPILNEHISEIINQFHIWYNLLEGGSASRKAYTYTGQHNAKRRRQTAVP